MGRIPQTVFREPPPTAASQRQRILTLLRDAAQAGHGVSGDALRYQHNIRQAPTRIFELKNQFGFQIETLQDPDTRLATYYFRGDPPEGWRPPAKQTSFRLKANPVTAPLAANDSGDWYATKTGKRDLLKSRPSNFRYLQDLNVSKANGFLQLRRGVFEHIKDGRMSHLDGLVFIYIASQADTRTGIWNGSAGALAGEICLSSRNARRALERLSLSAKGGYIKRFPVPGSHVCYPILVNKFLVTDGEHKGEHLNARDSKSVGELTYVRSEQECEQIGEHVTSQKILETREGRKRQKPAATPLADQRYQPFVNYAFKSFEAKHGQKPSWSGKDFKSLKALLKRNQPLTPAELERRWNHYVGSTEAFTAKQGYSLAYFCAHIDAFIAGPIAGPKEKISASDPIAASVKNSGLDENGRLSRPLPN
jgi:hypothetical protein